MLAEGPSLAMTRHRFPVSPPDGFLIALDAFMRRTGQGFHASQSVLELDRVPDVNQLRAATRRILEKHPLLVATLRRSWLTLRPYWEVPKTHDRRLPLGVWREDGSPGALGAEAVVVENPKKFLTDKIQPPYDVDTDTNAERRHANARLDVLELRDGRCRVAFSWYHILMDGKGAELLLAELARLCEGVDLDCEAPDAVQIKVTFWEKFRLAGRAAQRMAALANLGVRSLSGPKPQAPGRPVLL